MEPYGRPTTIQVKPAVMMGEQVFDEIPVLIEIESERIIRSGTDQRSRTPGKTMGVLVEKGLLMQQFIIL
jgi:hypothetical protein